MECQWQSSGLCWYAWLSQLEPAWYRYACRFYRETDEYEFVWFMRDTNRSDRTETQVERVVYDTRRLSARTSRRRRSRYSLML